MMISLSGKIRDRIPASASAAPKPCSPPPTARGSKRGRKPAAALPERTGSTSAIPEAARPALEAAALQIFRNLEHVLESAYSLGSPDVIVHLLDDVIPKWSQASGRSIMEALLLHERGFMGSTLACPQCEQGALRFEGDRPRGVRTMCGQIKVRRSYYICDSCGHSVAPLDLELGLEGDPDATGELGFLPSVQEVVGLAGSRMSFPDATSFIKKVLPDPPSLRTVERITRSLGQAAQRERTRERLQAYQDPAKSSFPICEAEDTPEVAVVAVDGGMCRMRTASEPYREFKMAVAGRISPAPRLKKEEQPPHVLDKTYTATFEGPDALFELCGLEFARLGLDRAPVVQFLGDGAPWIWKRVRDLAQPGQRLVETLDFYHACDHIREAAHAYFGPDSKTGRDWQKARQGQLLAGKVDAFLRSLGQLARKAGKAGRVPEAESIGSQHAYFRERRHQLNYKQCLAEGLLIGSGMIEGGIRSVGKDRLHRTGMRWSEAGAEAVLTLRCLASSGRWDRFCHSRAEARAARYQAFRQAASRAA